MSNLDSVEQYFQSYSLEDLLYERNTLLDRLELGKISNTSGLELDFVYDRPYGKTYVHVYMQARAFLNLIQAEIDRRK